MSYLQKITERVTKNGHPDEADTPRPLVTVEEFFEGNDCVGSIGCNLDSTPSPSRFHALFQRIAARADVADIRIQITAFDMPEWPFTDTVYIMTSASPEEVASWFDEDLRPDDVWEGFIADEKYEPYEVPGGSRRRVVGLTAAALHLAGTHA